MTRPRRLHFLMIGRISRRDGQCLLPILPIFVLQQYGDRGPNRLPVPYPGDNVGRILLDLHAPAAAVALLTTPEFAISEPLVENQPSWDAGEGSYQSFAVGFACSSEAQHALAL